MTLIDPARIYASRAYVDRAMAAYLKGKQLGKVSGSVQLPAGLAGATLTASGPTVVNLPPITGEFQFMEVCVLSGGKNVVFAFPGPAVGDDERWPKGQPSQDDFDLFNFQVLGGVWRGFGTGTPPVPDTTPPSAPAVSVASFTDTTVTLAVTRGTDAESTPTLQARWYVSGASTKPAFAPVSVANGQLVITGLNQLTTYVIEVQESSKGGTSAMSSVTQKTAMTHGWVVSSKATFDGADGTDPGTLTMSDGQAMTKTGSGPATILSNALTLTTAQAPNGANGMVLPASSTLKVGRVRAQYAFSPGSGSDTVLRLSVSGAYPLGTMALVLNASGALSFDKGGSNATWADPVWTGSQTGYPKSGTMSISVDADAKTVYAWSDGVQVGSITTAQAIPGMSSARLDLNLWGGGGISVSEVDILTFQ